MKASKLNIRKIERMNDATKLKMDGIIKNVLSINDSRQHGLPKTRIVSFIRDFIRKDADWFDKHKMVMLSYNDDNNDEVVKAIIGLVEKYADKSYYVLCKKNPNGKSVAFTGDFADELIEKSTIDVDKKFILKTGNTSSNYYRISYPLRKRLKCFGGERIKDVIEMNGVNVKKK